MLRKLLMIITSLTCMFYEGDAQVTLPSLVQDSMVLQRDKPLKIWGWASKGEKIDVSFNGKKIATKTNDNLEWSVEFPAMHAGGPYTMTITGKNTLELKDILIGDVWFCSGQSNMVHQLKLHSVFYPHAIENAHYPDIRQFWIPTTTSLKSPLNKLPAGSWKPAIPASVGEFSTVAYFFAKKIYEQYHVPIGIINASVGGTPIEAWISEEGLQDFPDIEKRIARVKAPEFLTSKSKHFAPPVDETTREDHGLTGSTPWFSPDYTPKGWRQIGIPGYWEDQGIKNLNGIVWYRRYINIPASMEDKPAKVFLGRIVDADQLYINGVKVGNTTYQYPQRRYEIPTGLLKPGKNLFVVRVENFSGKGGFVPDKPYAVIANDDTVDLKGYWQYKVGAVFAPKKSYSGGGFAAQNAPTALYNAMVAPVTNYSIKGILWYQGESNIGTRNYTKLMEGLIRDWRFKWKEGEIPFLFVQLPGFGDYNYLPSESDWAELREAQLKALAVKNTGMAVAIDLGEWNDIHPDRKKPIGERLALAAGKIAYDEDIVYSGPIMESSALKGNKIIISFRNAPQGLKTSDGELPQEFAIAGDDKAFVWAKAQIQGSKVVVWSDNIKNPRYVRYGWADNPVNPNLCNKEGLPASPFQADIE